MVTGELVTLPSKLFSYCGAQVITLKRLRSVKTHFASLFGPRDSIANTSLLFGGSVPRCSKKSAATWQRHVRTRAALLWNSWIPIHLRCGLSGFRRVRLRLPSCRVPSGGEVLPPQGCPVSGERMDNERGVLGDSRSPHW